MPMKKDEIRKDMVSRYLTNYVENGDDVTLARNIKEFLETLDINYTINDLETIVKIYRSTRLLGSPIDLNTVIIAVLSKDPISEKILRKKLASSLPYGKHSKISKNSKLYFGKKLLKNNNKYKENNKLYKINKFRKKCSEEHEYIMRNVKKFLETRNLGYLDLIEEQLNTMSKRAGGITTYEKGVRARNIIYETKLHKLIKNPDDKNVLVGLSNLNGGILAPFIIKYELDKNTDRNTVKRIQFIIKGKAGRLYRNRLHKKIISNTSAKTKNVNLRKTLYNFARTKLTHLVYKEKHSRDNILFIIDRSDSMKKHVIDIIRILIGFGDVSGRMLLFSDKPVTIKIKKVLSSPKIMKSVLEEGFSGYTDVIKALKVARRFASGKSVVLISDLEQTIKTEGTVLSELIKIASISKQLLIFTTEETSDTLLDLLQSSYPNILRKIIIYGELSVKEENRIKSY